MSLFDVIRYPATDIFSDEINSYPRDIIAPWFEYCLGVLGEPPCDIKNIRSFATFINLMIIRKQLDNPGLRIDWLKQVLTEDLQRRIREHE